ncbi:MAG: peptidoglycan-binding protein [Anaerococcus sp.]|nr:peptidoglycan-binding protein [Anaerococcus sp.]
MKKINIATLMLASALVLSACSTNEDTAEETETEVTEQSEQTEASDSEETTEEESEEGEEVSENAEGNVILHRAYPREEAPSSFTRVVVATSGDKIVGVSLNEYQYADSENGYEPVINSDKAFGEGTAEGKMLISKLDNEEFYSSQMKEAGSPTTLADTYKGIADFATGKTIEELETYLDETSDEEIIDAISTATFHSTPILLRQVLEAAKDDSFTSVGFAEDPEALTFKSATAAPHGDKSFADLVVVMEGDKIVAASFDEFQYMNGTSVANEGGKFVENYADSEKVLGSKLENNESYSQNMADKAEATTSIKDNFEAIQNFVAGKTVAEIEEALASAGEEGIVDSVTGATLVDTAGYLQAIVDTAKM